MLNPYNTNLPPDLRAFKEEIEGYARGYGLDFFETIFEVIDADDLNEIAAYGGFPTRYPHWSFGMSYEELRKGYDYGLSKIYEMVINNDPCYAYLMRSNHTVDQKLVMAHVYGHCDFFKNNAYFAHTNRKMMDEMANHGARIRRYVEKYGEDEVEKFVDRCMSIDDLIDVHSVAIRRREPASRYDFKPESEEGDDVHATRFKSKDYMDDYINPREVLKKEEDDRRKKMEQAAQASRNSRRRTCCCSSSTTRRSRAGSATCSKSSATRRIISRRKGMTKVLNEGWASFWHSTIMTQKALHPSEVIDFADHHSGTMAMQRTRINPYKLGIELLRDIEERWNTGRFGKEYDECQDLDERRNWDKKLGLGRQKIFEVRRVHNDITFIDTFLTPEFCVRHGFFSYAYQEQAGQYVIESREFEKIKQRLLFGLTNFGKPWIYVVDGNYRNRGELLLRHQHNGVDLRLDQASDVLANLQFIWSRPVHLQTLVDGKPTMLSFDGTDHAIKTGGESDEPKRPAPAKTR